MAEPIKANRRKLLECYTDRCKFNIRGKCRADKVYIYGGICDTQTEVKNAWVERGRPGAIR
jgi:hypothetical protein